MGQIPHDLNPDLLFNDQHFVLKLQNDILAFVSEAKHYGFEPLCPQSNCRYP